MSKLVFNRIGIKYIHFLYVAIIHNRIPNNNLYSFKTFYLDDRNLENLQLNSHLHSGK